MRGPEPLARRLRVRLEPAPRDRDAGPRQVELDTRRLRPRVAADDDPHRSCLDVDGMRARNGDLEANAVTR